MAIHANSTPARVRTLLPVALPSGGLLPAQQADLLAILADAPDMIAVARLRRPAKLNAIHALIEALDAMDVDCDLEPYMSRCETGSGAQPVFQGFGGDECEDGHDNEPNLGSLGSCVTAHHLDQRFWAAGGSSDCEQDVCDEPHDDADSGDKEPDLGALEQCMDQRSWAVHAYHDDEHTLGAPEIHHDQRRWAQGRGSREMDHDEHEGLRSSHYSEAHQRTQRIRHETEAALRRKGLSRPSADVLQFVQPGVMWWSGPVR